MFIPNSERCKIGDGSPKLAMTEQGDPMTDTIIKIELDYLVIDVSQGIPGQNLEYFLRYESYMNVVHLK